MNVTEGRGYPGFLLCRSLQMAWAIGVETFASSVLFVLPCKALARSRRVLYYGTTAPLCYLCSATSREAPLSEYLVFKNGFESSKAHGLLVNGLLQPQNKPRYVCRWSWFLPFLLSVYLTAPLSCSHHGLVCSGSEKPFSSW